MFAKYQKELLKQKDQAFVPVAKRTNEYTDDSDPLFYYYKRWVWIMFPWVCLSVNLSFSDIMEACFKSPTEYMSSKDEYEYTKRKFANFL